METYPELRAQAQQIAQDTLKAINRVSPTIESAMPYKAQFILEEVVAILQASI